MKNNFLFFLTAILLLLSCNTLTEIEKHGKHYQKFQDHSSLKNVLEMLAADADTADVKRLLGEPIDMGFDYRYLLDSVGPNGCVVGAVFHIDDDGKIDQKWIGEICE